MNTNFKDLYNTNMILSCDTECFPDYWNFIFKRIGNPLKFKQELPKQIKYNPETGVYIFECWNDEDCILFAKFYNDFILGKDSIMYFYNSDGYDKPMINVLLNLVANKETNILLKLRKMNDLIIKYGFRFKEFSRDYWQNFFKDQRKYIDEKELFEKYSKPAYRTFYNDFKHCIRNRCTRIWSEEEGKSINKGNILDIQAIAGFSPLQNKSGEGTSMSLKQLQLLHLGMSQKFDFNKYDNIQAVINDNMYDTFISYSENDVVSLEFMYYEYMEGLVKDRFYAIKAIKLENLKDISYDSKLLFTNKKPHTELIVELLKLEGGQQDFTIDYTDYIQTDIPEFNDFVSFVNNNKGTKNDNALKTIYKERTGVETAEFELNGVHVKGGFGGAHGAKSNYKNKSGNLYDFDYKSQYPSTILEYKEYFSKIMNVELYEAVYNLRQKYKKLSKDMSLTEEERTEYKNIQKGLKLILNSTYGLINSEYDIPIANKTLGRFVILKCQSLLYNLCTRNKDLFAPNINTDGVYFEIEDKELIQKIVDADFEANGKGYFELDVDMVEWTIQNDVNNYIAKLKNDSELRTKGGAFNLGIKQKFNKNSNLDVNLNNAIKLFNNEEIIIEPLLFKGMKNLNSENKYYLTTPDKGINPVNNLKHPVKLSIDNNDIFVTDNIDQADIEEYKKFAELVKIRLENFNNKVSTVKYFEHELTADTNENNKIFKHNINRIKKLLDCDIKQIGYSGFRADLKSYTYYNGNPINPLINYTKTVIRDSVESKGIVIDAADNLIIIDVDIFDKETGSFKHGYPQELVDQLSKIKTYKSWNNKTKDFKNFKLIFKNDINKILDINPNYSKYIETLDRAVVWSLDNLDRIYFDNDSEILPISQFSDLFEKLLIVKHEDAADHLKKKEEKEQQSTIIDAKSNDIIINAALNLLKEDGVDIFQVVEDNKGVHIHTSCPYCSILKNTHYNNNYGTVDAYVNINETERGFKLNIHTLSSYCSDEQKHLDHFKNLNNKFKSIIPSKEELENIKLFQELQECVDIKYLKNFFIKDTIKIVGTGGGKTVQSAAKLAYNVFHNGVFTIFTTKENSNIDDFEKTFKWVVSYSLKKTTRRIDNWLDSEVGGFKQLNIHKLKSQSPIAANKLPDIKAVVTNHKYFYNVGHKAEYNKNMIAIREAKKKEPMEIIVDEYESFKERGLIVIQLNDYYYYKKDLDTQENIYIPAKTAFYPCIKKLITENETYEHARENLKQDIEENEGIHEYKLKYDGTKNLYKDLHRFCEPYGPIKYDCGRRKPKKIHKNSKLCYVICDKIQQYKLKDNIQEDGLKNNFKDLLYKNEHIAVVTQVLKVSTAYVEDFDVNIWGEEIGTIEELIYFGLGSDGEGLNAEQFATFKDILSQEAKELFINYLSISVKSILGSFECPKYYLTANEIQDNDLNVCTELAYQSSPSIKNIDVAILNRESNNDSLIIENMDLIEGQDFKTLTFLGLSKSMKDIINHKNPIKTDHLVLKSVVNQGEKTVNCDTSNNEDINDYIVKTGTMAYINGTESQGRNYKKAELLIINGVVDINVKGRLSIDCNGDIIIKSIEQAAKERLKQAFGRIFRGDVVYKAILILGEEVFIKEIFKEYGEKYTIKFNTVTYNKTIDRHVLVRKAMADIIEYFGSKFAELNTIVDNEGHAIKREVREVPFFNADLRKENVGNKRNTKVEGQEVYNYYIELVEKFYKENGKKPKDKELLPEIIEKFKIKDRQFRSIKQKYKD